MRRFALYLATILALSGTAPAAEVEDARFDVVLRGIKAGQLVFRGQQTGSSYQVAGRLQSTGLVGRLVTFSYDAQSAGTVRNGRYTPSQYTEQANTGKRQQSSVMRYRAGVPQVREITPARAPAPYDLNPATQGGTVDILTALYAALRDQNHGDACALTLNMFDGRRRSLLRVYDPKPQADGGLICAGEYRRVGGFHPDDMAERTSFGFQMRLAPAGDMLRVVEITTPTLYGQARMRRR